MSKHTAIRLAVLDQLKTSIPDRVTWFDGRPVFLEEQDLPALAVYLTDAEYTGESPMRIAGKQSFISRYF